jgi:hypothetical protein
MLSLVLPPVQIVSRLLYALEQRYRPRCGRDQRPGPHSRSKSHLQIVPRPFGLAPFGKLVAPGEMMFRPAKTVGIVSGKQLGDASARPADLAQLGSHFTRCRCNRATLSTPLTPPP